MKKRKMMRRMRRVCRAWAHRGIVQAVKYSKQQQECNCLMPTHLCPLKLTNDLVSFQFLLTSCQQLVDRITGGGEGGEKSDFMKKRRKLLKNLEGGQKGEACGRYSLFEALPNRGGGRCRGTGSRGGGQG